MTQRELKDAANSIRKRTSSRLGKCAGRLGLLSLWSLMTLG